MFYFLETYIWYLLFFKIRERNHFYILQLLLRHRKFISLVLVWMILIGDKWWSLYTSLISFVSIHLLGITSLICFLVYDLFSIFLAPKSFYMRTQLILWSMSQYTVNYRTDEQVKTIRFIMISTRNNETHINTNICLHKKWQERNVFYYASINSCGIVQNS